MISLNTIRPFVAFADFSDEQCTYIAARAAELVLAAEDFATYEGEAPAFFFILQGTLELSKRVGITEQIVHTRTEGDHFGEVPILLGTAFPVSARAVGPARVLRIDAQDFLRLLTDSPAFAHTITGKLVKSVTGLQEFAISIPSSQVTLVGYSWDPLAYKIRDFLARNRIVFAWEDFDPSKLSSNIPSLNHEISTHKLYARLNDGSLITDLSLRNLADKLGMRTEPIGVVYDLAIIGGGPTGLSAAVYGSSEGLNTLVIEREAPGGQAGTSSRIENYLGFPVGIAGDDLGRRAFEQANRLGADFIVTREVVGLQVHESFLELILDGNQIIRSRAVLIATGVDWKRLPVPGIDRFLGCGVYYGAARTEAVASRGTDVYLIGGGNSVGQSALFFSNYARKVTILIRNDDLKLSMSAYLIAQLKARQNIYIEPHSELTAVEGDQHLEGIQVTNRLTKEVCHYQTNALIVLIGGDARTNWLPTAVALDEEGYIVTGTEVRIRKEPPYWPLERDPYFLETSVPGIFAAGDVRSGSIKRVASSVGEGGVAVSFIHSYLASLLL